MAKSPPHSYKHREWWCLLLIPFTLLLLDSYGWIPRTALPLWTHREATVYRVKAEQTQPLSLTLAQPLGNTPVQARLTHPSGDVHLLVTQNTGPHSLDLQVSAVPAGHYILQIMQGETPLLQEALHVVPKPQLLLDRYFVKAGDTLSLWRSTPTETRYTLSGQGEGTLTAQNPHSLAVPEDLSAGKHQLQINGVGSVSFDVLKKTPSAVTVAPHHDLLLPGVEQSLYLHVLDAQAQPLEQGWVRINEQSYPIRQGLAVVNLPAKSIQPTLFFTTGVAEGQIEQGTLQLQLAQAPWAIRLVPEQLAEQTEEPSTETQAQQLQWIGPQRAALSWQAQQGHHTLSGQLPAAAPLSALYDKLNAYFQSDSPVSLRFVDAKGRSQSMVLQFPSQPSKLAIQPSQPHALSTLTVNSSAPLLPWINHYVPGTYAWSNAAPSFDDDPLLSQTTQDSGSQPWIFLWLMAGLLCSSLLWWRAEQSTRGWQANIEQSKRLKQARNGVLLGASLWLLSLPAAWLGDRLFMGQTYLLGLTLSSFSLIWAMRKAPLLQPVWVFTQTALLLLCFWFNLTYWPAGQSFVIVWTGLLLLGWLSLFERWQRLSTPSNSRLVLAASLAVLSLIQCLVALRGSQTQIQNPAQVHHVRSHSHYPVALLQPLHSQSSPARFSLAGQGGAHLLSGKDAQGLSYVQTLNVMETPRIQAQAPAIAQRNDLLQLPVRFSNPTPGAASLPLRLQGPSLNVSQTQELKAGESKTIYLPIRYAQPGINTYTLSQFYDGQWHTQDWQTYVNNSPTTPPNTGEIKFSPLRLEITYPEQNCQVGGEIAVVVDFQHRLPEDTALALSIGIPAGFSAITDTLMTDKTSGWLADFRPSTSQLNLQTTVLRAGQRVRFHYRLKAEYAGAFQTPEAVLSSLSTGAQREFAESTVLKVAP